MKFIPKNIINFIKKPFQQGLQAKEIIKATIVSLLITIIPIFGVTSLLLTFISLKFKLNLPIMIIISYIASPLQFLFIIPFIRIGEYLFNVKHTLLTFQNIKISFALSFWNTLSDLSLEINPVLNKI